LATLEYGRVSWDGQPAHGQPWSGMGWLGWRRMFHDPLDDQVNLTFSSISCFRNIYQYHMYLVSNLF
jgi:hypothetical protein